MTTTVFTTILVALITAVLGPIIVSWVRIKLEKKSLQTPMSDALEKFSIFYEKCTPETPNIQGTFQNIPVSLFPRVLSKVYKDNELYVSDVENDEDTYGLEFFTNQCGTKAACIVGLHSLDDHLIGIMGISFKKPHHLEKDEWIFIRQKVGVVGTLLSEYLYTTTKK